MESRDGGGSDPSASHFPRRLRRAGRSRPGTPGIQKISGANTDLICTGYKPDQLCTNC